VIFQNVQSDDSEFLIEELDWALKVSKSNKQGEPTGYCL